MNPFDPPGTAGTNVVVSRGVNLSLVALVAIAVSLLAPIATSYFVIDSLVGMENLKRHYWFTDGLVISFVLNAVFLSPLLLSSVRRFATPYAIGVAVLTAVLAYAGYEYWMIALMGV